MKLFKKILLVLIISFALTVVFACEKPAGDDPIVEPQEKEYTISWVIDGETVKTDKVKEGATPDFGSEPTKEADANYIYTFSKWNPEVVAATEDATYTAEFTQKSKRLPSNVAFETQKFPYDGKEHKLEVTNLPEGATVTYVDNSLTEPGNKTVKAVISYYGKDYTYTANLIVEKSASVLTIETTQTVSSGEDLAYSVNNEEQVINYIPIFQPGTYYVDVYAVTSAHYLESAHYEVKVIVTSAKPLGIEFESCKTILTGDSVELVASNIPEGYTATYDNNVATEPGKKHVVCHVFDGENNEVATLKAVWTVDYPKNDDVEEFLDYFLVEYLGDEYSYWNTFFKHPEKLGLDRSDMDPASWYVYEPLTEDDAVEARAELVELHAKFDVFKNAKMSNSQKIAYDYIGEILDDLDESWAEGADLKAGLKNLTYIDSYGGYVGDLNSTLENYIFNYEQNVIDAIDYLKSSKDAFPSYVTWAEDKITAGYPLSNYTIDEMVDFIDGILKDGENYYLIELMHHKVDGCEFLDDTKKAEYKEQITNAFKDDYMPALQTLKAGLLPCKGQVVKEEDEGYWAKYEGGEDLYLEKLRNNIGKDDLTIDEYLMYVNKYFEPNSKRINAIVKEYRAMTSKNQSKWIAYIEGTTSFVGITDPVEMVDYLKNFAKYMVPEFENDIAVNIKYMDDIQAEHTNTQAYYYKSALDEFTEEYITLNRKSMKDDANECLSTMAHEGYPGHLYAHVFIKDLDYHYISMIFDSTGFAEGWAKYVEYYLKQYILETTTASGNDKKLMELAIEYLLCNSIAGYLIYCVVDEMAHYEHKTLEEITKFVTDAGYSESAGLSIYRTVIENPVVYNSYGFGQIYMLDCHLTAREELGFLYNEVDFNRVLLEKGQRDLWTIMDIKDEYVKDQLFLYADGE